MPGHFVGVTDGDQVFVAVSDDLAALLGYRAEELVGRQSADLVVEPDGDGLADARRLVKEQRALTGVLTLRHRAGRLIRYAYTIRAVSGRGPVCYVTLGRPLEPAEPAPEAAAMPSYVTKEEAATIARVSVRTVDRWIGDGVLPAGGGRGSRRIELARLQAFLAGG